MFNFRISRMAIGGLLVILGILLLLQTMGLLRGSAGNVVWGATLGIAGGFFVGLTLRDKRQWWWILPGLTFLGIAAANFAGLLAPAFASRWSGLLTLGSIGLAFIWVYLANRTNWWALIPGGVLLTLGVVSALDSQPFVGIRTEGVFFLGLGLTFLVLRFLPTQYGRMQWAIYPAVPLLLFGLWLSFNQDPAVWNLVWPVALVLVGLWILARSFRRR